jgi:hypothetical protein
MDLFQERARNKQSMLIVYSAFFLSAIAGAVTGQMS